MNYTDDLAILISDNLVVFNQISDHTWSQKDHPDRWSRKEILGHLVDSAMTNLRRFIVTQYAQGEKIVYFQDAWVEIQNYNDANIRDLIELWRLLNLQIIRVIHNIPENKLQYLCDTGKHEETLYTLEFLITDYVVHMKHHLKQLKEGIIH